MFCHDDELQFEVGVGELNPKFAKMLRQAIGGVEGAMRVALQYPSQAFAVPTENGERRQLLMQTATEELGHAEMLATAVSKTLDVAHEAAIIGQMDNGSNGGCWRAENRGSSGRGGRARPPGRAGGEAQATQSEHRMSEANRFAEPT